MAAINPQRIHGRWHSGVALDVHTVSSMRVGIDDFGRDRFDTKRTELGELLYRLKYRADRAAGNEIAATAARFLTPHRGKFDLIVPIPPSAPRALQPVVFMASGIGAALNIPVAECVTKARETAQIKAVEDAGLRQELMAGLHTVDAAQTAGRNILLFDDLYRSGTTLNSVTDVLLEAGKAASVRVLTITYTRSKR